MTTEWRERIEAVQAELWVRADINDPATYHFARWANELLIALNEAEAAEAEVE